MNKLNLGKKAALGASMAAMIFVAGCNNEAKKETAPAEISLDTTQQKVTYIVGYNMAQQAETNGVNFDADVMNLAIKDVAAGSEPRIAKDKQQEIMMAFQEEQQAKREEESKKQAEENKAAGETFLAENAKKEGVTVTDSGLQYKVLTASTEADAASPKPEDTVEVHYHGTLIDGTVFDSSVDRGQPVTFPVNGVIAGWTEALQLMKVGDKYQLTIPSELAYGERGTSGKIGPSAVLIFDVELLAVNPDQNAKEEESKEEKK